MQRPMCTCIACINGVDMYNSQTRERRDESFGIHLIVHVIGMVYTDSVNIRALIVLRDCLGSLSRD